jgi:hypothetical protein
VSDGKEQRPNDVENLKSSEALQDGRGSNSYQIKEEVYFGFFLVFDIIKKIYLMEEVT